MAVLETYANRLYLGHECQRWSVHPKIIIGGSILDYPDWRHLEKDFGVASVINVETEHDDSDKGIDAVGDPRQLLQCPVPDDGTPFPAEIVRRVVSFANIMVDEGPIYVHCQQGGSRSPAFAYAILRWTFRFTADAALAAIRAGKPKAANYGDHHYHRSYLTSVESALVLP